MGCLTTTWHLCYVGKGRTPRGGFWACGYWLEHENRFDLEHLCRFCRNCGYSRAEALAGGDDETATEGLGWRSALTGRELGEAARPHLAASAPEASIEDLGNALLDLDYQAVRRGDNIAAVHSDAGMDSPTEFTFLSLTGPSVTRWTARTGPLRHRWAGTVLDRSSQGTGRRRMMGQQRKALTPERSPAHRWGWELRTRRDNAGLSLAALGNLTRFDRSYLARAERGEQFPSRDAAEACDRALSAGGELTRQWHQASQERKQGALAANAARVPAPASTAELPPFNEHASCPKCLSDAVRVTYHPAPAPRCASSKRHRTTRSPASRSPGRPATTATG
ncbi:MAG TPA: helix-turn-helix transcriptional regulator [Trebonia sp.]|nr:helix-turn-helix transcriptional regulator [Trebonia sp.]